METDFIFVLAVVGLISALLFIQLLRLPMSGSGLDDNEPR